MWENSDKSFHVVNLCVEKILKKIEKIGVPYQCLTDKEKVDLFQFKLYDNRYNLKLYFAVQKAVRVHDSMDESYEDYQKTYDKTVEMQIGKEVDKKEYRGMEGDSSPPLFLKKSFENSKVIIVKRKSE